MSMSIIQLIIVSCLIIIEAQKNAVPPYVDFSAAQWEGICSTGKQQSPIDFQSNSTNYTFLSAINAGILFNNYPVVVGSVLEILGSGKFRFARDYMGSLYFIKSGLVYRYDLLEIHFHTPSDHSFGTKKYDLEMHMVHVKNTTEFFLTNPDLTVDPDSRNSKLAIGTIFSSVDATGNSITTNNSFISNFQFWNPGKPIGNFTLNQFASKDNSFYHYEGSLTTPPCPEYVNWIVNTKFETISAAQVQDFKKLIFNNGEYQTNSRRTQNVNERKIYTNNQQKIFTSVKNAHVEFLSLSFVYLFLYLIIY